MQQDGKKHKILDLSQNDFVNQILIEQQIKNNNSIVFIDNFLESEYRNEDFTVHMLEPLEKNFFFEDIS